MPSPVATTTSSTRHLTTERYQPTLLCSGVGVAGFRQVSFPMRSYQADDYLTGLAALIPPRVTRPVLHYGIARMQMYFYPIIQFQPDFTRNDVLKINRVRGVHARMGPLQVSNSSRQFLFRFLQSRFHISWRRERRVGRRKREQTKPESAQGWEIRHVLTRRSVIWKRRSSVCTPEAVEFHLGEQCDCNAVHIAVTRDYRFAIIGVSRNHSPDSHSVLHPEK